jgi:exopolyphosphatase/guanosine-5'-triphosphate,3'-diphosphate pyrophosphatase
VRFACASVSEVWFGSHEQRIRLLTAQGRYDRGRIVTEVPVSDASFVVALGSEMRFVADDWSRPMAAFAEIGRDAFMEFAQEVAKRDEDELVSRYRLSPDRGGDDGAGAAGLSRADRGDRRADDCRARRLAPGRPADRSRLAAAPRRPTSLPGAGERDDARQRYRSDSDHVKHVAKLATRLFDNLAAEHGLNARDRLLLEVAALLHDIGLFVSLRGHHKHAMYLLQRPRSSA